MEKDPARAIVGECLNKNGASAEFAKDSEDSTPGVASRQICTCCECALAQAREAARRRRM
jgi:hypothetical protein